MVNATRNGPRVPSFGVKLNGEPLIADIAIWIVNIVVEDDLNSPGMFTLELISKQNHDVPVAWTDEPRLSLGTQIEISMGYGDERKPLIVGEIMALEPSFTIDRPPTLVVRGFDRRHRLSRTRRTRSFVEQKDSDIAEQIGADAGVLVAAIDSGVRHPYVLQSDQTDLEFLRERARRMRYELAMQGEVLMFRPIANDGSTVVTLTLSGDLFEFRPRMCFVPMTEVSVLGWDPKQKQAITAAARVSDEVSTMAGAKSAAQVAEDLLTTQVETVVRSPVASQAEADQIAIARFNAAALEFIRAEGRARGRTDLRAGAVIRIEDLGKRFSGQYYVTSVVHRYSRRDGYLTDFCARRNAS